MRTDPNLDPKRIDPKRIVLTCIALAALCATPSWSQTAPGEGIDEKTSQRLEDYLASGEFGSAVEFASALAKPTDRDAALALVAKRQAAAGAGSAAIHTAVTIRDDLSQFAALRQQPVFLPLGMRQGRPGPNAPLENGVPGQGGGTLADFDTLIELISTTVAPESWEDVGGAGSIAGFPNGVLVDPSGLMRPVSNEIAQDQLSRLRRNIRQQQAGDVASSIDGLRTVSLPRLETALLARQAAGLPPTEEMLTLGGLGSIDYVLVYPETHDVILAGRPAVDGASSNRLADLCVVLASALSGNGQMVCSITPRQQNLAATQTFLQQSAQTPLKPSKRQEWLDTIQQKMGRQDIEFQGVDPQTNVAQVLVAADYHMKLVGMGIVPGVDGVRSYLDSVRLDEDGNLPPLEVLRWWFTLRPSAAATNEARDTFRLPADIVRVQSENEMLSERGARIHTGQSEPLNREFAASFTKHFAALAHKYPVYAELENVFRLAVAAAIIRDERLADRSGWQPTLLASSDSYVVPTLAAPAEVESVVTHKILDKKHVIAGVSGGVDLAPQRDFSRAESGESRYELTGLRSASSPDEDRHQAAAADQRWWWIQ